jgi:hypothetical protein
LQYGLGEIQVPQELTVLETPQLSLAVTLPQVFPNLLQKVALDSGVHEHCPVELQVCGEVQVPQELTVLKVSQLSLAVTPPQFLPNLLQKVAFVSGVHDAQCPKSQICGEVQVPQFTVL